MSPTVSRILSGCCCNGRQFSSSFIRVGAVAMSSSSVMDQRVVTLENMNPHVIKMEYAVRGPLVIRATAIEKELLAGAKKPFKEVTKANIGDAHAMGQKPISFLRQVLSLCLTPELFDNPIFPEDAKERARNILNGCKGRSVGSYSDSPGIELIRRHIAEYIERRDGFPSNWEDIVLCAGASEGIRAVLKVMINHNNGMKPGVMIPIPQYPLYSASIAEFDLHQCGYYLDESNAWALNVAELERSIEEAKKVCVPKVIVVINPGNPTGQVLSKENIIEIIKFAHKEKLFIFADEAAMECVVNPPKQHEPSYASFMTEKKAVLDSLALRAKMIVETFNSVSGITCNVVQGAMYAFPEIKMPEKLIKVAEKHGQPADVFYAFQLLENTGICIIPGSGFGQVPGTYHFRTTILPQPEKLKNMLEKFTEFHIDFMKKYQ